MKTSLFDYDLPDRSIARYPASERDGARLAVLERNGLTHASFRNWPALVAPGSLVVLNDTRVYKARIEAVREGTGGRVQFLLLRRLEDDGGDEVWLALGHANRPLGTGATARSGPIFVEVLGREEDLFRVRVHAEGSVAAALELHGHVPLPPYLRRADEPADVERYQTVFAERTGSVAAPTAGLHLTRETLDALARRGVRIAFVTLHVGLGTFRPVSAEDLDEHAMHAESFEVSENLANAIRAARSRAKPVVAVGTTVVRALESARDPADPRTVLPCARETRLLVQPGYAFGPTDSLLTNFHQPRSTLLALVAAFAGLGRVLDAYRTAVDSGYRFLSYGDAMWIPERLA